MLLCFVSNVRQLFAADDFSRRNFQMHFFLGALRVNGTNEALIMECAALGMKFGLFIFNHPMIRIEVESSMCESEARLLEQ